jgi:hypothetical protein
MDTVMSQASKGQECAGRAARSIVIPSARGGIGHISRTAALAWVLRRLDPAVRARHYARLPATEVWGIGGRTVDKLQRAGIVTIADFVAMDATTVRDLLTVVGARVQAELRGVSCLPLALAAATRKGVAVTRSFGHPLTTWQEMREGRCCMDNLQIYQYCKLRQKCVLSPK